MVYVLRPQGIIVWQDMPSGDKATEWIQHRYFDGSERVRSAESEKMYRDEWREIMDCLYNYPCISAMGAFQRGLGQFKTPGNCCVDEGVRPFAPCESSQRRQLLIPAATFLTCIIIRRLRCIF